MNTKHTPGPWILGKHGVIKAGVVRQYTNGESQDQIAMACGLDHDNMGSQEANARLIAAAPDLLEALIELEAAQYLNFNDRDARKEWRFAIIKAKAAINKATATTAPPAPSCPPCNGHCNQGRTCPAGGAA